LPYVAFARKKYWPGSGKAACTSPRRRSLSGRRVRKTLGFSSVSPSPAMKYATGYVAGDDDDMAAGGGESARSGGGGGGVSATAL